jgi:hypothetical protein
MKINHTGWKSIALAVTVSLLMSGVALAGSISISGTVFYCSNPALPPVPGVTMILAPPAQPPTLTDALGHYSFSSLPAGSYTVMPSMAALAPGSAGINTADVIAIQRHFICCRTPPCTWPVACLTGCQLVAADVNGDGTINAVDIIAIQRFSVGLSTGIANVGKYQFDPPVSPPISTTTVQDFNALIFGDVAPVFVY